MSAAAAPKFDPGFENTHDDHCRTCYPHDVPAGTTVICEHRNHHHHTDDPDAPRHSIVSAGGAQPFRFDLDAAAEPAEGASA